MARMSEPVEHGDETPPRARTGLASWIALAVIIALLIAVALPMYGDYAHRSQAAEAVSLLSGAKTALAEYYAERKQWPGSIGEVAGATSGRYTQSLAITKGAGGSGPIELTATLRREGVDRRVAGTTVQLVSEDGGRTWTCRAGTILEKYLPGACRTPG